jgi:hypothetical protein
VHDPTSEAKLVDLLKFQFKDLLDAKNEKEIRNARDNISATGIAFLLSKLANKNTESLLERKIMQE